MIYLKSIVQRVNRLLVNNAINVRGSKLRALKKIWKIFLSVTLKAANSLTLFKLSYERSIIAKRAENFVLAISF